MSLHVEKITKLFNGQKAVDSVTFSLNKGEILGFLGPNGAGKTTVMRMLTGCLMPSSGTIFLDEQAIELQPITLRKRIGYLPEDNPLYTDMYVTDYLKYMAALHQIPPAILSQRIKETIDFCGLADHKLKRIKHLSKGYKQRVGIAQALIHNPDILILDEPTTGLDPNQILEIRSLIKELSKDKTIILSSHILTEIEATCNRVLIIKKGQIIANDTPQNLRLKTQNTEQLIVFIEAPSQEHILQKLHELPTIQNIEQLAEKPNYLLITSTINESSRKHIYQLCVEQGWNLLEMTQQEQTLEDIFRELTIN